MKEEIPAELPGPITEIRPQKKSSERYSLFVGEAFVIGLSGDTLLEFGLKKGDLLTPELWRRLREAEGRGAVKSYMVRMLGRRDHARRELSDKARRKDLNHAFIDDVLDELERKGYLDDRAFAVSFARDKYELNRWGPSKIRAHLRKKGIGRADADRALEEVFEEADLQAALRGLVEKRRRHFLREEDPFKRKKKIFDYLARKGFRAGSIHACLDELTKLVSE
ncbi:MAG: RecX family transcriptional regulator [Balneolaceae bacterium]|nr:RecX family transcriptional regulator [Balneolaceae bacterium]